MKMKNIITQGIPRVLGVLRQEREQRPNIYLYDATTIKTLVPPCGQLPPGRPVKLQIPTFHCLLCCPAPAVGVSKAFHTQQLWTLKLLSEKDCGIRGCPHVSDGSSVLQVAQAKAQGYP